MPISKPQTPGRSLPAAPVAPTVSPEEVALADLGLDTFEGALLPQLRHFTTCLQSPQSQAWQLAYRSASERWGETFGLAVAHALFKVVRCLHDLRGEHYRGHDALTLATRAVVTADEAAFLRMLHHMRRDDTPAARDAVADLTGGWMDPHVIRAALSFADRFPAGKANPAQRPQARAQPDQPPRLRVVR
ncbi:hypothetical protein [Phaeobacter inhibens]|uniref:hypothetical protein n=1 Tax=Phaeobacter inhibens TaxID=221822 RepID=UPI000C9BFD2D|nr:hypothetical protein [Phaeobacter inhibens]AUQ55521.1 hypothetical protein PhaeoP92_02877 [Phaeobacter inhibens]AUQ79537.1 hypothetical protein PhaeoP74_02878 [Phaeobacter inhibens]AUR16696.1 hypothetical protein PhaeoP70_02876 [Phaeobacter inhibens]